MKKYEILIIIDKDVQDDAREKAIEKVTGYITTNNGTVAEIDKWGMKKFAYPINFKNEGFYVLIKFELDPSLLLELKRIMGIDEAYVREMVTAVIENKKTLAPRKVRAPRPQRDSFVKAEDTVAEAVEVAEAVVEAVEVAETVEAVVEAVEAVEEVVEAETKE